jgi:hypothetical protein
MKDVIAEQDSLFYQPDTWTPKKADETGYAIIMMISCSWRRLTGDMR